MNNQIRVLQVLTIMNRGGAENMIMNYYRNMDRSKVQFDFLLHRQEEGAFDQEIESLGGKIYRMPAISPKNYFRYKQALSLFFDEHPEYQIVHSHLNALSSFVLKEAKKRNIPLRIAHSHLAVEPFAIKKIFSPNTDVKATIKDSIQSLIRKSVRKYATHYFACGQKAGDWLYGKGARSSVEVINNAIDSKKFIYDEQTAQTVRKELAVQGKKVIGHVGRFNEQKNHFFLIEIFEKVAKALPDARLILIGDGNLRLKIEQRVKELNIHEQVIFLGLQDNIPRLLQSFDLFLFPSLYEGLPVTLIEAQASGIPIVASDTITSEVDITGLLTFCSLSDTAQYWAEKVVKNIDHRRENTYQLIVDGKYDIAENARKLQEFYLNS